MRSGSGRVRQCTDTVLMLRPNHFGHNEATAGTNLFQHFPEGFTRDEIHQRALQEFEQFRRALVDAGVNVIIFDDTETPQTPDAIFPNNWFSTHQEGSLVLYPMEGKNRREERRADIVRWLTETYGFKKILDLTTNEEGGRFLEGTGSMVIDRPNRIVYACRSSRTDESLVHECAATLNLQPYLFEARVMTNEETGFETMHPIYHTNVMMAIGESTTVICVEVISNKEDRRRVVRSLEDGGHHVVEITASQVHQFAGNLLQLRNQRGEHFWVMSTQAHQSLTPLQRVALTSDGSHIFHSPLNTIEYVGGGSARCMLAEIFYPSLQ